MSTYEVRFSYIDDDSRLNEICRNELIGRI